MKFRLKPVLRTEVLKGALVVVGWMASALCAQEGSVAQVNQPKGKSTATIEFDALKESLPVMKMRTLGGKQLWTDHSWREGWKMQQNALTGHWRLIDDQNTRQAWGTEEACQRAMNENKPTTETDKAIVVLLHGLLRSSTSMVPMGDHLAKQLDCTAANFEYASTRGSISDHAKALGDFISSLPSECELRFVGHSMGNIVVRHLIKDLQQAGDEETLSRIKHVIMIGPPNQGASIARQLSRVGLFKWVAGQGGMELGPEWKLLKTKLAVPHCPFAVIAGKSEQQRLKNPLVDGAGDLVVSVEEAHLEGESDFLEVDCLHTFLMTDPIVKSAVVRFIRTGSFQTLENDGRSAGKPEEDE